MRGHTIGLPPTSTHPGNKERGALCLRKYFTHGNVKHEWHRLALFAVIRLALRRIAQEIKCLDECSSMLFKQGHSLRSDACNVYLIHNTLKETFHTASQLKSVRKWNKSERRRENKELNKVKS